MKGEDGVKKGIVIGICVLLLIIMAGGALFLYHQNRSGFTAEEIPFGLTWGMSEEEVEERMFEQNGYCSTRKVNNLMLFEDISWKQKDLFIYGSFEESGLSGITVNIYVKAEKEKDSVAKHLESVYKKADSVEVLMESNEDYRMYIMEDKVVVIDKLSDMVLFSVDAIAVHDNGEYNAAIDTYREAKAAGKKTVYVP